MGDEKKRARARCLRRRRCRLARASFSLPRKKLARARACTSSSHNRDQLLLYLIFDLNNIARLHSLSRKKRKKAEALFSETDSLSGSLSAQSVRRPQGPVCCVRRSVSPFCNGGARR